MMVRQFLRFFVGLPAVGATFLSLHDSQNDLTVLSSVNVTSNRLIVESTNIMGSSIINTLEKLYDGGIAVLCSVRYKSVPADQDGALANFSSFVAAAGPLIHSLVLGNEPDDEYDSEAKQEDPDTGVINAVAWITKLAQAANAVRADDPNLDFLLVNPEPNIRYNTVNGWSCKDGSWPGQLLAVGSDPANGIDKQDIHLHMEDMDTLSKAVTKVQACASVGLLTTEWSQAPIVSTSGWTKDPCELNASVTNGDFINACYHSPVSQDTWTSFVSTAPYDPSFMQDALAFFKDQNFTAAAYGGGFQYGNPSFDTKQLYASLTVDPTLSRSSNSPASSYPQAPPASAAASSSARRVHDPGPEFWNLAARLGSASPQQLPPHQQLQRPQAGRLRPPWQQSFGEANSPLGSLEPAAAGVGGARLRSEGGGTGTSEYTYEELAAIASEPLHSWFVDLSLANPDLPSGPAAQHTPSPL